MFVVGVVFVKVVFGMVISVVVVVMVGEVALVVVVMIALIVVNVAVMIAVFVFIIMVSCNWSLCWWWWLCSLWLCGGYDSQLDKASLDLGMPRGCSQVKSWQGKSKRTKAGYDEYMV
jgi:hypothetical protein